MASEGKSFFNDISEGGSQYTGGVHFLLLSQEKYSEIPVNSQNDLCSLRDHTMCMLCRGSSMDMVKIYRKLIF